MGQSHVKCFVHLIFSTKYRKPQIDESIESELHRSRRNLYSTAMPSNQNRRVCRSCTLAVRAVKEDHLDEIFGRAEVPLVSLDETKGEHRKDFYWQGGYGAFSASPSDVESVKKYIEGQHEHHKVWTMNTDAFSMNTT